MSSLSGQLKQFHSERADTVQRNIHHARPSSTAPARTSTPKPSGTSTPTPAVAAEKRSHDAAFPSAPPNKIGQEILTQVVDTVAYIKSRTPHPVSFEQICSYLSLPQDQKERNERTIKRALQGNERAEYLTKEESGMGKEAFRYRPLHPVRNEDELRSYLARQDSARGVSVKDLKDGWPDCQTGIDQLEKEGHVLVTRNKKDSTPRYVWADSPMYHITNASSNTTASAPTIAKVDPGFAEFWSKIRLPASENDIRTELERAGITPTSAVREANKGAGKKVKKARAEKKNAKKTNVHMAGILKDYSNKKVGGK